MRQRRPWLVITLALTLIAFSCAIYVLRPPLAESSSTGFEVTIWRGDQPISRKVYSILPALIPLDDHRITIEPMRSDNQFLGRPLSSADRPLVEFLLLLPPATLLICLLRNLVGMASFGTFAPALLGLAFRDVHSLVGVFVMLTIITAGWWLRRGLNELHLLQVPRTALLLSGVVVLLLTLITVLGGTGPLAISLFPLVILTGMIERFWAMEEEDGTGNTFTVLGCTLLMAGLVCLLARLPGFAALLIDHPELLGLPIAGQLLLGRYTGLRWLERRRFAAIPRARVLGINARNAFGILDRNPRGRFPIVDDKVLMMDLCRRIGVPCPAMLGLLSRHAQLAKLEQQLAPLNEFVLKPARGSGGRGIMVIIGRENSLFRLANGQAVAIDVLRERAAEILAGQFSLGGQPDRVLIQERVRPHPALRMLAGHGVADVRIVLYRFEPAMAMLRLPTLASGGRANLHQGGIGVGIDLTTGRTTSALAGRDIIDRHPDTGMPLADHVVPEWQTMLEMATKVARAVGLGYVGIDIVLDERYGPLLLEANARPGLAIQIVNQQGLVEVMDRINGVREA